MALWAPKQKKRDHFLSPTTPQNGVGHVCFMRLALLGGFLTNFKNFAFWRPLQVFTRPGLTERATHSVKVVN